MEITQLASREIPPASSVALGVDLPAAPTATFRYGLPPAVSSVERRWVVGFAALIMLVTSLPYLVGYSAQGDAYRFTGLVFGVEDGNSYIAKMLDGAYGAWLFRSPYSAFPQNGLFMYLPYLLLGKLASPPGLHEQLVALFHLFRLLGGFLAILASYDLLAHFIVTVRLRRLGLALICLGGGLGWLLVMLGQPGWTGSLPLDFFSPETFGFLALYGLPHLAMARALLLWSIVLYLKLVGDLSDPLGALTKSQLRIAMQLSIVWFLAGLFQPLTVILIGVVIGVHLAGAAAWQGIRHRRGEKAAWGMWGRLVLLVAGAALLPGLLALYNAWLTLTDPYAMEWAAQNLIYSPNVIHYILAYGIILPYAWIGGRRLMRLHATGLFPPEGWLLVGWVLVLPLLAYAPFGLQRRLVDGVWVAWCTLAMASFDFQVSEDIKAGKRRKLLFVPLGLLFLSTLFLLVGGFMAAARPSTPLFRPIDEIAVFQYLQSESKPGAVVLGSYDTSNPLPAWAPVRVLAGHGPESIHLAELLPQVKAFYSAPTPDSERLELLDRFDVRYIFWGPAERALGDWTPSQSDFLYLVFQSGDYWLFERSP